MRRIKISAIVASAFLTLFSGCVTTENIEKWRAANEYTKIQNVLQDRDQNENIRIASADALIDSTDEETVKLLISVAQNDREPLSLCEQCVAALGEIAKKGDNRSLEALKDIKEKNNRYIYIKYPLFDVTTGTDLKLNVPLYYAQDAFYLSHQGHFSASQIPPEVYELWSWDQLFHYKGQVFTPLLRETIHLNTSSLGTHKINMISKDFFFKGTHREAQQLRSYGATVTISREDEGYYPIRIAAQKALSRLAQTTESTIQSAYVKSGTEPRQSTRAGIKQEAVGTKTKPGEQKPTDRLALKFIPDDIATYKVAMEYQKGIEWMGSETSKPVSFKGGHTGNKIELTFTQQILSTNENGNAVAMITIRGLKYFKQIRDNVTTDFDSSAAKDANSPLAKLIGQIYTIQITPTGQVNVIDANEARAAVTGASIENITAVNLLKDDMLSELHSIPPLPSGDQKQLRVGESWSNLKNFSFDLMGSKSYERIYTLKKIENKNEHKIAVAEMEAVPSVEGAKELYKEQGTSPIENLFDNQQTYTGLLKLDITKGEVEEYSENLRVQWVIADPSPESQDQTAALKMVAVRSYSMEKIE